MIPEAWAAHFVLWAAAAAAVVWLLRRTAARAAGYQAEAFAGLEADRAALARFVAGIDARAAEPAVPVPEFVIHVRLPADATPADVSAVRALALERLKPLEDGARPLPVRIEAPVVGP